MTKTTKSTDAEPLIPHPSDIEHLGIPELQSIIEQPSKRFCALSFLYFFTVTIGLIVLLEFGIALMGTTLTALIVVSWISGVSAVFILILWILYVKLSAVSDWFEKKFKENTEEIE